MVVVNLISAIPPISYFYIFFIVRIVQGEDKIIKVKHDLSPKRFPGGLGTVYFNKMKEYKKNVAQVSTVIVRSYCMEEL